MMSTELGVGAKPQCGSATAHLDLNDMALLASLAVRRYCTSRETRVESISVTDHITWVTLDIVMHSTHEGDCPVSVDIQRDKCTVKKVNLTPERVQHKYLVDVVSTALKLLYNPLDSYWSGEEDREFFRDTVITFARHATVPVGEWE